MDIIGRHNVLELTVKLSHLAFGARDCFLQGGGRLSLLDTVKVD